MVFVDFSKAYDRVPRGKMFMVLKSLGCGSVMLSAITAMYKITTCILGTTIIQSSIGVRQGSPTSCFLFVMFVDVLVKKIKENVDVDDFLGWLHTLMLMDDTVILATSREKLISKLKHLENYCENYGMVINEKKTKLMVLLGDECDKETIRLGDVKIKHCEKYIYLGAVFTADGSTASSLKEHVKERNSNLNKLSIFLAANYDAPYVVKKKVFQAAFSAAILYGMESWLDVSLKPIELMYMKGVRALLGVRISTPSDLCLIEAGIPPLKSLVHNAQARFFRRMAARTQMTDDPFGFVVNLTEKENPKMWLEIQRLVSIMDHVKHGTEELRLSVTSNVGSKFCTYRSLNPLLSIHPLYYTSEYIPDSLRISFSRLRLSSHKLRIEIGRWSKTPRHERLCGCGAIQDEKHILTCPDNEQIMQRYGYTDDDITHLFDDMSNRKLLMLKELLTNLEA